MPRAGVRRRSTSASRAISNAWRGGSLIQYLPEHDRPEPMEHRELGDKSRRHWVRIEPGTMLHQAVGKAEVLVEDAIAAPSSSSTAGSTTATCATP